MTTLPESHLKRPLCQDAQTGEIHWYGRGKDQQMSLFLSFLLPLSEKPGIPPPNMHIPLHLAGVPRGRLDRTPVVAGW